MTISKKKQKLESKKIIKTGRKKIVQKKEKEKETILPLITKQTVNQKEEKKEVEEESEKISEIPSIKSPTFFDITPPKYIQGELSLSIPVDLIKIKKNAVNSISKIKFSHFLQNPSLNELIDALISDSFWFIVCFFQSKNNNEIKPDDDNQTKRIKINNKNENFQIISQILKRMSCNYFKFFIRVCDMGPSRKNDPALNVFRDFMSQSVYYSIYLAFPKSRYLFGEDFRNRIVSYFAYLYNGLTSEHSFVQLHWELDLGKGNIIENFVKYKDEHPLILPDLYELQVVLEKNYRRKKFYGSVRKNKGKKGEINSDILNTPLYRLYAETNTFETLNLVKPIKMPNRKIIDIYQISKLHANYVKFAKDTLKNVAERKAQHKKEIAEKDAEFQNQINEVKANENRIKKELADIKVQNVQEYANYCIFISSK
jgi:hypothetical protein